MNKPLKRCLVTVSSALLVGLCPVAALAAERPAPDLGFGSPSDFSVNKAGGQRLLRYSNLLVNVGQGPMEVRGTRSSTSQAEMTVNQWIYPAGGGALPQGGAHHREDVLRRRRPQPLAHTRPRALRPLQRQRAQRRDQRQARLLPGGERRLPAHSARGHLVVALLPPRPDLRRSERSESNHGHRAGWGDLYQSICRISTSRSPASLTAAIASPSRRTRADGSWNPTRTTIRPGSTLSSGRAPDRCGCSGTARRREGTELAAAEEFGLVGTAFRPPGESMRPGSLSSTPTAWCARAAYTQAPTCWAGEPFCARGRLAARGGVKALSG